MIHMAHLSRCMSEMGGSLVGCVLPITGHKYQVASANPKVRILCPRNPNRIAEQIGKIHEDKERQSISWQGSCHCFWLSLMVL